MILLSWAINLGRFVQDRSSFELKMALTQCQIEANPVGGFSSLPFLNGTQMTQPLCGDDGANPFAKSNVHFTWNGEFESGCVVNGI